uniref:Lipocalin n=1 Tax=Rhipicephalus appendiculatus TaxID=34631 RepID=A0A131Z4X6_RHIAP
MQKDGMISAFVSIFIIAPLQSGGWWSPKVTPDMTKFLNTSEPIWSYMTTSTRRQYDCKVDVIDDMYNEDVLFRRFLGYRKVIVSEWVLFLEGRLYRENSRSRADMKPFNAMKVSYKEQGTPLDNETLIYQSSDNICGIVQVDDTVNDGQGITYELRVKNSSIEAANRTDCIGMYQKIVKKKAKVTYLPDCQDILIGMNNILPGGSPDNGAIGLIFYMRGKPPVSATTAHFNNRPRTAAVLFPSWLI